MKHVVLVHGASHGAWCWYKVVTRLQTRGFIAAAIDLTSMGENNVNPDSVSSIAEFAKPLLDYLEDAADKVILVGHSLGGITISYAMEKYPNKIDKAVFLVAHMPLNNQSFITTIPKDIPPTLPPDGKSIKYANGRLNPPTSVEFSLKYVREFLYDDCPEEDVELALSMLSPQPFAVYPEILTLTSENYGSIPRFYILTSKDRLNPPCDQRRYIDMNPTTQVYTIDSGHSPFFSQPSELSSVLEEISKLQ